MSHYSHYQSLGGPLNYHYDQRMFSNPVDNKQALLCNNAPGQRNTKIVSNFYQGDYTMSQPEKIIQEHDDQHEYHNISRFFIIESKDRDRSLYPSPADFKIDLPQYCNNITRISITGGTVPKLDNVDLDPYLYLDVPELNYISSTSNNTYFGILSLNSFNTAQFLNLDKSCTNLMHNIYIQPKLELRSIHIKLLHPNGDPVDFGTQTDTDVLDYSKQTSFIFEVVERKRKITGVHENSSRLNRY